MKTKGKKPKTIQSAKNRFFASRWSQLGLYWLISYIILLAFYFSEIIKNNNYLEIFPSEAILPMLIHAITALIIGLIALFLPRPKSIAAKTITALFLALSMINYDDRLIGVVGIFRSIIPILPSPGGDLPLISLLYLLILVAIGAFLGILVEKLQFKHHSLTNKNIVGAVLIFIGFLFLGQAIPTINIFRQISGESAYQSNTELIQAESMKPSQNSQEKPDIYYIVLEDYVSNKVLKEQFNSDNSMFTNYLREKGFSVDENANSQYPFTGSSIASTLNMSYHDDDVAKFKDSSVQSGSLFFNMTRQSEAIKLLKKQGYAYYHLGNSYGAINKAPLANIEYPIEHTLKLFSLEKSLRGLESTQFNKSVYYQFAKASSSWWPLKVTDTDEVSHIRNQLKGLDDLANDKKQGGRFIFANILAPHPPAYFNVDGSMSAYPSNDNTGAMIKQKYFGEVQFMNDQISTVINTINKNSGGNAVILLVSDEGTHPSIMNQTFMKPSSGFEQVEAIFDGSMSDWPTKDLQMKFGTLQAVYIPKATSEDFQNMSGVNAFRVILNQYFGYSYEYLPNCQLASSDGRRYWYKYTDVTQKVTGKSNPACKQYE